jgi:hypothetical protein
MSPHSDATQPDAERPAPAATTRQYRMKYGTTAFNRYREVRNDVTHDGKPIPPWGDLGHALQDAWIAAGMAAAELGEP